MLESWEALESSGMLWCGPGKSGELRRGLGGYGKPWEVLGGSSGMLWEALGVCWIFLRAYSWKPIVYIPS